MASPWLGRPSVQTQPGQMGSPYPSPYGQPPGPSPSGASPGGAPPPSPYGPGAPQPALSPVPGWMGRSMMTGLSGGLGMPGTPSQSALGMPDYHANLAAAQARTLRRPTYFQARAPMGPTPWGGPPAPMPGLSAALRGF